MSVRDRRQEDSSQGQRDSSLAVGGNGARVQSKTVAGKCGTAAQLPKREKHDELGRENEREGKADTERYESTNSNRGR